MDLPDTDQQSSPAWAIFQLVFGLGVFFSNIYFAWGLEPLTAGVIGGMGAWFLSRIGRALLDKWRYNTPFWRWGN